MKYIKLPLGDSFCFFNKDPVISLMQTLLTEHTKILNDFFCLHPALYISNIIFTIVRVFPVPGPPSITIMFGFSKLQSTSSVTPIMMRRCSELSRSLPENLEIGSLKGTFNDGFNIFWIIPESFNISIPTKFLNSFRMYPRTIIFTLKSRLFENSSLFVTISRV